MKEFEDMTVVEIRRALEDFKTLVALVKEEHALREARGEYIEVPEDVENNEDYRYLTDELSYNVSCSDEIVETYED